MVATTKKIKVFDLSEAALQPAEIDLTSYDQFLGSISSKLGYTSYSDDHEKSRLFIFNNDTQEIDPKNYANISYTTRLYYINLRSLELLKNKIQLYPEIENIDREYEEDFRTNLKDSNIRTALRIDSKSYPPQSLSVLQQIKTLLLKVFKPFQDKNIAPLIKRHADFQEKLNKLINAYESSCSEELKRCKSSFIEYFQSEKQSIIAIKIQEDIDEYMLSFLQKIHLGYLKETLIRLKNSMNSDEMIKDISDQMNEEFQMFIDSPLLISYLSENINKIHQKAMGYLKLKDIFEKKSLPSIQQPVINIPQSDDRRQPAESKSEVKNIIEETKSNSGYINENVSNKRNEAESKDGRISNQSRPSIEKEATRIPEKNETPIKKGESAGYKSSKSRLALETELKDMQSQLELKYTELTECRRECQTKEREYQTIERDYQTKEREYQIKERDYKDKIELISRELQTYQQRQIELESRYKDLLTEKESSERDKNEAQKQIAALQKENRYYEDQTQYYKDQIVSQEQKQVQLKKENEDLWNEKSALELERESKIGIMEALMKMVDENSQSNSNLEEIISRHYKEMIAKQLFASANLRENPNKLEISLKAICESHIDAGMSLKNQEIENAKLKQELKLSQDREKDLNNKLSVSEQNLEKSRQNFAEQQYEFNRLKDKLTNEMIKFSPVLSIEKLDTMLFIKFSYQNYLMAITHLGNSKEYLIAPFIPYSNQIEALIYCARVASNRKPVTDANLLTLLKFDNDVNVSVFIVDVSDVVAVNVKDVPHGKFDGIKPINFEEIKPINSQDQLLTFGVPTFGHVPQISLAPNIMDSQNQKASPIFSQATKINLATIDKSPVAQQSTITEPPNKKKIKILG